MLEAVKEESSYTKALLAKYPEREWKSLILEKALKLRSLKADREATESEYAYATTAASIFKNSRS